MQKHSPGVAVQQVGSGNLSIPLSQGGEAKNRILRGPQDCVKRQGKIMSVERYNSGGELKALLETSTEPQHGSLPTSLKSVEASCQAKCSHSRVPPLFSLILSAPFHMLPYAPCAYESGIKASPFR